MWSLISEKDKREYQIIQLLFHSKKPLTSHCLAKMTNSSVRSIKNYLSEIRDYIEKMNGHLVSSSEGYVLTLPTHISIDYFQHRLFKRSLAFQFLEEIFFNPHLTSEEMEKRLFVGTSTINRLVSDIRQSLKNYNLILLSNPYRIEGDEFLVRSFFKTYFNEAYHFNDWPFKKVSKKAIHSMIPHVMDFYKLDNPSANFHQLSITIAVDITRELNGYVITNRPSSKEGSYLTDASTQLEHVIKTAIKPFGLSKNDMALYMNQINNWNYYFSLSYLKGQIESDSHFKQMADDLKRVINELCELFSIPKTDQTAFVYEIVSVLNFYKQVSNTTNARLHILFKPRNYFLVDIYKQQYPTFYTIASRRLCAICREYQLTINKDTFTDLMYLFLTRWERLTRSLFYNYTSCKVILFSHISQQNAENIKQELLSQLNQAVDITIYEEHSISEEELAHYHFDLLLTTTTLSLDIEQPIHYVHRPHLTLELDRINEAIDRQIKMNKEKLYATKLKKAKALADKLIQQEKAQKV